MTNCKKLLAIIVALVMLVSTLVSGLVVSAAEIGTLVLTSESIAESDEDTTATVELTFNYPTAVAAPHNLIALSADDSFTLESIAIKSVNGKLASEYDTELDPEGEVSGNPCPVYFKENGIDLAAGKILLESITVDSNTITDVVLTATYTIPAGTEAGEYPVTATAEYTDYYECDDTVGITNCDIVINHVHSYDEGVVTDPTCVADGYTTYTCTCGYSYTEAGEAATGVHNYVEGICSVCGAEEPKPDCDHADAKLAYDKESGLYTESCECGYENTFEPIVSDETIDIPFTGKTLDLNDSIGLNFYIDDVKVNGADDFYLNIDHKISDGSGDSKNNINIDGVFSAAYGGEYRFSYPDVAAKEMVDVIYATVCVVDDGYIYSTEPITYNPRQYADTQLPNSKITAACKTLIVDMLNYGAEAQKQFKYNTNNLANAGLDEKYVAMGSTDIPQLENILEYGDNTQTVKHSIPTISLENKVELVYYVSNPKAISNPENLSLVVNFKGTDTVIPWSEFEYVQKYDEYRVNFAGVAAKEMSLPVNFTMYENYGTEAQTAVSSTMTYSIESYVANRKSSEGQTYTTSIAMMRYGRSALTFFGA